MNSLSQLKGDENQVITELFSLVNGAGETVLPGFYEGTVFGSQETYFDSLHTISISLAASQRKAMIETPLTTERGPFPVAYHAKANKGVDFGIVFIHYKSKKVLLAMSVTKTDEGYSYKSTRFDNDAWVNGITHNFTANTIKELTDSAIIELTQDVAFFTNNY